MWEAVNPDLKERNLMVTFVGILVKGNWVWRMTKLMTLTLEKPVYFDLSNISYRKPYLKIFGTIKVQFQHLRRVLRLLDFQTVGFS